MKFSKNFVFFEFNNFIIILLFNFCQSKKNIEIEFLNKNNQLRHIEVQIDDKPIGEGTNAWIYYGELKSELKSTYGNIINEVAVKIYKNQENIEENKEIINEIKILETFNNLPYKQREGIIELFFDGRIISKWNNPIEEEEENKKNKNLINNNKSIIIDKRIKKENKKVLILEYGENMPEKINNIREYLDEGNIWFYVYKTLLAIKDLHRLIIHLDLKPLNMVFSKDMIKIIDFESGQFIKNEEEENNILANKNILIIDQYTTQLYRGPENNIKCYGEFSGERKDKTDKAYLSTKSDIWSIGITILEYILESPSMKKHLEIFKFLRGAIAINKSNNIEYLISNSQIIKELNFFYKMSKKEWNKRLESSYKITKETHELEIKEEIEKRKKASSSSSSNNNNIENNKKILKPSKESYLSYIILILQIQKAHPLLFRMITASLEYKQEDRPSALGLLDFMLGKCYFSHEIKKTKKYSKKPIFINPKLILKELDSLKNRKKDEIKKHKPLFKSVTSIDNEALRNNEQNEIINKINEIKDDVSELLNQILKLEKKENKEIENKWNCYKFIMSCIWGGKDKTKIDLRRLKWDETTFQHKPKNIECDTENIAKVTFINNNLIKEIINSEMSGYEGDAGGRSSFSLPTTPLRKEFSSSPITDYSKYNLLTTPSWSPTPKREEYSSYVQESDLD